MADISNKTLSILLVGAIVLSLMGTMISLGRLGKFGAPPITGTATQSAGTASLTIASQLSITVVDSDIDFGSCRPGSGNTTIIDSNNTAQYGATPDAGECSGIQDPQNITLENDGNQVANVTINTNDNDITGGTNYSLYFAAANATDSPGCVGTLTTTWTNFTNTTPNPNSEYALCSHFNYTGVGDANDRIWTFVRVWIPADAVQGPHSATLTFTAAPPQ